MDAIHLYPRQYKSDHWVVVISFDAFVLQEGVFVNHFPQDSVCSLKANTEGEIMRNAALMFGLMGFGAGFASNAEAAERCGESIEIMDVYDYNSDGVFDKKDTVEFRRDLQISIRQDSSQGLDTNGDGVSDFFEDINQDGETNFFDLFQFYRLDVNDDHKVDVADSVRFFQMYKKCSLEGDVNQDGVTDMTDLHVLMTAVNKSKQDNLDLEFNTDLNQDGTGNLLDVLYLRDLMCRLYDKKSIQAMDGRYGIAYWVVQTCNRVLPLHTSHSKSR